MTCLLQDRVESSDDMSISHLPQHGPPPVGPAQSVSHAEAATPHPESVHFEPPKNSEGSPERHPLCIQAAAVPAGSESPGDGDGLWLWSDPTRNIQLQVVAQARGRRSGSKMSLSSDVNSLPTYDQEKTRTLFLDGKPDVH